MNYIKTTCLKITCSNKSAVLKANEKWFIIGTEAVLKDYLF